MGDYEIKYRDGQVDFSEMYNNTPHEKNKRFNEEVNKRFKEIINKRFLSKEDREFIQLMLSIKELNTDMTFSFELSNENKRLLQEIVSIEDLIVKEQRKYKTERRNGFIYLLLIVIGIIMAISVTDCSHNRSQRYEMNYRP